MEPLRLLDLFSGIGGFSLGLERSGGFRTVAFCEIEPYCRRVLAKHWPEVLCYHDIRELTAQRLMADGIDVDAIRGGFPCQDISFAGKGAGIGGERSGLWREYARLIGEIRPRYVIVENVPALLVRGMGDVLGDLATLGYDAEWSCISAEDMGAAQQRDRVWVVAYGSRTHGQPDCSILRGEMPVGIRTWWASEPGVGRVADGVPNRMDRLTALGNAVVPQIPEMIGRAIVASRA